MPDWIWIVFGGICCLAGTIGCLFPVIPGSIVAYVGILLLLPTKIAPSVGVCISFGLVAAFALVSDNIVPMLGAKKFQCSKWGVLGCFLGTFAGFFFSIAGLIIGPFVGAFLGELLSGNGLARSVSGGFGAFVGFVVGMVVKVISCIAMIIWYVHALQGG